MMYKEAVLKKIISGLGKRFDVRGGSPLKLMDALLSNLGGGYKGPKPLPKPTLAVGKKVYPQLNKQVNILKPRTVEDVRQTIQLAMKNRGK